MGSFFKRKNVADQAVGIGYFPDGIAVAKVAARQGTIFLEHLEFRKVGADERKNVLKKTISEAGLKGLPSVFVIDPTQYSLLQIEAPEVPAEELKSAVRWRIKDMIDYHLDDAEIEIVHLPQSKRAGSTTLMYVLASRTTYIQSVIDDMTSADLQIKAIDVTELALRNMTFADAQENRAGALLYLSENLNLIEICVNGCMCLSRHINMDFSRIDPVTGDGKVEMMDMLSLEVQRSMDYYESQYADGAASQISMVSQVPVSVEEFKEVADSYLTVPVKPLAALEQIKGIDQYDPQLVSRCLPSIGAAIRDFVWQI